MGTIVTSGLRSGYVLTLHVQPIWAGWAQPPSRRARAADPEEPGAPQALTEALSNVSSYRAADPDRHLDARQDPFERELRRQAHGRSDLPRPLRGLRRHA